ncbi:MAG TPA: SlyX family protein [Steroidobacteraceae bacterium]|nr:SlyX family protein [Steroidobacteraceae bacterium]
MNETALERLELKVAYLERANNDLSDVVYRQQGEIDALRVQLQRVDARMTALQQEEPPYTQEEERPPHY